MFDEFPEPIERLQEILAHPSDKTFNALHDKGLSTKKELSNERQELATLMTKLPATPPKPTSIEYKSYIQILIEIQKIKEKISQKHNELMEILKNEEKISREIQEKNH